MNRSESLAYLTRCADSSGHHWFRGVIWAADECPACGGTDDAGWHKVPCSRYGRTTAECAEVAYRFAYLFARETGEYVDEEGLDQAMSMVVNDHPDVASIIRQYGHRHYR